MLSLIKKEWSLICLILALFVLSRILFLFFAYPIFFWGDELRRGILAQEIVAGGLSRPLFDYQVDHFSGGSLVSGLLAVPFFLLLGASAFTLKLVGLTFFALALLVWILFIFHFFNRNVAILFSFLFIFSPPSFTKMSLITMGYHSESILFTAAAIFIFYKIFFEQKNRWPYFIALGFVCGTGLWFTYIFGITLFSLILCWFFFDKKFLFKKNFWIFSLGFLSGFSPWIYYNLNHNFQGLYIHGKSLPNIFTMSNIFKIFSLKESVIRAIPGSLSLGNIWIFDRKFLSIIYFSVFIIAYVWMALDKRKNLLRSKKTFFIIYCFIISIFYQLKDDSFARYLIPLYPFIFVAIALFSNRLFESKIRFKKVASISLIFLLAIICLGGNINILTTKFVGYGLKVKGFFNYGPGLINIWKYKTDVFNLSKYIYFARDIDPAYRDIYFWEVSERLEFQLQKFDRLTSLINEIEPKYRRHFYSLIGKRIGSEFVGYGDIDKAKWLISRIEPQYQHYVYEGWVESIVYDRRYIDYESKKNMAAEIDKELLPIFYSLWGWHLGLSRLGSDYFDINDKIDKKYLPCFFEGVGKAIVLKFTSLEKRIEVSRLLKSIDEGYRPYVCQGIGQEMALLVRDEPANVLIWNRLLSELPSLYQRYCQAGFKIER